jgi:hypothetical protein
MQSISGTRPSRPATEADPVFYVARDPETDEFVIFVRHRGTSDIDFQLPAENIVEMGVSVGLNAIL